MVVAKRWHDEPKEPSIMTIWVRRVLIAFGLIVWITAGLQAKAAQSDEALGLRNKCAAHSNYGGQRTINTWSCTL